MKSIHLQLITKEDFMKKYITLFILMIITLTSCVGKEKMGFNTRDKMNLEMAGKIVECINKQNVDGLYNLFSEEAKINSLTLRDDIEKLYKYLNGQIDFYEKDSVSSTTDIEKGENSTYYYSKFKIIINNIEYCLYYIYYPRNDFNSAKEGVESFKIVKVDDIDKYFCYWQDMKPGVFLPDEAK